MSFFRPLRTLPPLLALALPLAAQEASVNPGINDSFQDPKPTEFVERFEKEGREVYDNRELIVAKLGLEPGMAVADVGSGTGLFTRLIAAAVGSAGKVYAVDIAKAFVDHTVLSSHARGLKHVEGIVCAPDDVRLPPASVDLVFLCDTYHHFEFPYRTMASVAKALKPGGRVVMIDFERIEGKSSDWILDHVRAGKEVFRQEIEDSGFAFVEELDLFEENYFLVFRKR
jgi:ubiquinone/menaquinone biosynthesis C-methylase UbiE